MPPHIGKSKANLLMQNARQLLRIVTASFGKELFQPGAEFACAGSSSDVEDLACEWQKVQSGLASASSAHSADAQWIQATSKVKSCSVVIPYPQTANHGLLTRIIQWLKHAQELMSSMASNYNMPRLIIGQVIAVVSLVLAALAAKQLLRARRSSVVAFAGIVVAYGVMMFASSYVEEEHHFWYWTTTAWLVWLGLAGQRCVCVGQYFQHPIPPRPSRLN